MQVTLRQFVRDMKAIVANHSAQKALQLGKGQCKDYAEYKWGVGYIAGMEAASEIAEQMIRQYEEAQIEESSKLPEMDPETPE